VRPVHDPTGDRLLVLREVGDERLTVDPLTGERRRLPAAALTPADGAGLGADVDAVRDARTLTLLVELEARGPLAVVELLAFDLCESDLNGLTAELRAAGLIAERDAGGRRGYGLTEAGRAALARARDQA
jgi:hypothetical protein